MFRYLLLITLFALSSRASSQIPIGLSSIAYSEVSSSIEMPEIPLEQIKLEDSLVDNNKTIPWRFGYKIPASISPETNGTWQTLADGSKLWQLKIICKNAQSINIQFTSFHLADGSYIYLYNTKNKAILGPYDASNNNFEEIMASSILTGDEMVIEYFEPNFVTAKSRFIISNVVHGYRTFNLKNSNSFGASGSCENNVNCPIGNDWQKEKRSVGMIVVGGSGFCSGALLNNVLQDSTPFFLTAYHCTQNANSSALLSWVFVFNYESPNCNNINGNFNQAIVGATMLAGNKKSDFSLLKLKQKIPMWYRPYFAGWNNTDSIPDSIVCIHHPEGDIKKISFAYNKCQDSSYFDAYTAKCWKIGHWDNGLTEPGSSGSPLFNKYHEVVGQLFGGPSYCGCDDSDKNDYYGKFSVSWNDDTLNYMQAKYWLDPNSTNATKILGFDPGFANGISSKNNEYSNLLIYPNPSNSFIKIVSNNQFNKLEIYNIMGQSIYFNKFFTEKKSFEIDLGNFNSGIYFIKVSYNEKSFGIEKVIKY
ncbi:MAG: hypothetical protein RL065_1325 [Bacteroidota bacterium]|jgi:hypothetical protein